MTPLYLSTLVQTNIADYIHHSVRMYVRFNIEQCETTVKATLWKNVILSTRLNFIDEVTQVCMSK